MAKKKINLILAGILILSLLVAGCGGKKDAAPAKPKFPTKPITLICPWSAGGGADAVSRALAKEAQQILGQPVNVVNQTGGSGAVGMSAMVTAKPDGYTVGYITYEFSSLPPQGLVTFDNTKVDGLLRTIVGPAALTVRKDAPYNTMEEFVKYAKANPKSINIGAVGTGSVWHIAGATLAQKTGIDVKFVPYEGAGPAIAALVGGHIQAVTVSGAEVLGQVKAGQLKILGVMSDKRQKQLPDVKTMKEQGFDVEVGTYHGMIVPKGVPQEIRTVLEDAFTKAYQSDNFKKFLDSYGWDHGYYQNSKDFDQYMAKMAVEIKGVLQTLGLAK